MEFIYQGKKESELDFQSDPRNLVRALPGWERKMDAIKLAREITDAAATSGPNGVRLAGYAGDPKHSGLKVVARIPEALLTVLCIEEPGLIKDSSLWHKWLKNHPEFRAYSPGSKL